MWRARPVFVSSTFLDMQAERDHLRSYVFPELEERLRARRQTLEWVDLRIGVATTSLREEHARELQVLKVCLAELRRCRPFLIVLLGDRYGWIPEKDRMSAAAAEEGFAADLAARSVTDLEIDYGVLSHSTQQRRSRFYFRKPLPYERIPREIAALYSDANDTDPAAVDRAKRLATLKQRIDEEVPGRIRHYAVDWDAEKQRITGLEVWGRQVLEDMWEELQAEAPPVDIGRDPSWQEVERAAIEDFVEERSRNFVGRASVLAQLSTQATSVRQEGHSWGICLTGESGTGKSAIFGEFARRLCRTGVLVLAHATAASARSPSVDLMLRRWIGELAAHLGVNANLPDDADPDAVEAAFRSLLGRVALRQRVVVLVDGVDQFEATIRGRFVTWVPRPWPPNAKLIMTAVPGEASEAVLKWPGVEPLPVQPLDGDEARAIAEGICARYHRTLETGVLDALLSKKGPDGFAWATPLWVVLAVEELNVLDADDFTRARRTYLGRPADQLEALMVDMVAAMPPDALELYRSTFDRAEELFGPNLTRAFLGSIAVSRAGWRTADFGKLLPHLSDEPWEALRFASLRRLFRGQVRQRGGFGQWDFTHRLMRVAVRRRLAALAVTEVELHAVIAEHLLSLAREDPLRQSETMVHLLKKEDWPEAARFFGHPSLSQEELNGATLALAESLTARRDGDAAVRVPVIDRLLDAADRSGPGTIPFHVASRILFALNQVLETRTPLAVRADLNRRVLATLGRHAKANPSDSIAEVFLSQAHTKLADVLRDQGDLAGALDNYETSLDIRDRLTRSDAIEADLVMLSMTQDRIGDVRVEQGNLTAARDIYQAALTIKERVARAHPSDAKSQHLPSVSLNKIGDVLRLQGDLPAALHHYETSLAIRKRLVAADPGNADWQRDLLVSLQQLGDVRLAQSDLPTALDSYRAALVVADRLAKADPSSTVAERDLSVSHDKIGDVLLAEGSLSAALDNYKIAHAIRQHLATADPGNAKWQRDLAVSQEKIGDGLCAQRDFGAALTSYNDSLAIRAGLVQADPGNRRWQRDVSFAHIKIAEVRRDQGDLPGALDSYRSAVGVLEALVQADASNADALHALSAVHERRGAMLRSLDRLDEAVAAYRAELDICERLAAAKPDEVDTSADLVRCHDRIATLLIAAGRFEEALVSLRRCEEAILGHLGMSHPHDRQWQQALSVTYYKLGDLLVATGETEEALAAYRKDLAIAESLAASEPGNADLQRAVSISHNRMGEVLAAAGKQAEALNAFRQRLAIAERIAGADPDDLQSQRELAVAYDKLGDALAAAGRGGEALRAYEKSISIREKLTRDR